MKIMSEIKQSNKGIPYAEPKRLSTKQKVYTQAILQKIPHNTEGKVDITLKLGRYNISDGGVETQNPRSELTLTYEELINLVGYIEEYYKPLELNAKKFISIENETSENLLLKFKTLMKSNEEIAIALLDNRLFTEDIQIAIDAIKKKKAVSEFEKDTDNDYNEAFWQKWFNDNKWILGSEYLKILDERGIDIDHIADFIVQAFDGFVDIVEIKKPNLKFWAEIKDHNNYIPSSDLTKAITQCQNYLYEIEREANSQKYIEKLGAKIIKPRCLLVFGKSKEWDEEKRKAYRILNSSYTNLTILTYDHLLERAKNIINKTYNDIEILNYDLQF
jgi:hypothetical protein